MAGLKLDPFIQRRLLDLAAADQVIGAAEHRRRTLPELAVIAERGDKATELARDVVVADTEVGDLRRAMNKLEMEIDQVRGRAQRDADRVASGSASAKELENLQHEIESLKRRQGVLEDAELELMEQREVAESVLADARTALEEVNGALGNATTARDAAFAEIDALLGVQQADRSEISASLPADVLALYTRILGSGQVAAAQLAGARCGACRIEIDRTALSEIRSAPVDEVVRCSECGAILIRS
ncbi:hypothetical protein EH165_05975 [Nakamurella antarctica]|uniref:Uncharacterized protein n=1 Tax=Nakamurella antarctica TaxID=1902245 RepID=A0A3G8ZKC0_9ACTN|nr:C4-type zinc ribbon domain-containing protein [Nakamurella antarctica]AZI57762.1 hypothetical protein EH165_05975 [Nakamurella antarctica]